MKSVKIDVSGKRISVKSLRNLDFFLQNKCPYISFFIKLMEDIGNHFFQSQEIEDYFIWTKEIIDLEKECFYQFTEDIKQELEKNPFFSIEHVLEHFYLYSKPFKKIEEDFSENLQIQKSIKKYTLLFS